MADFLLKVSRNALLDRLRVLQSDLTGENRHSDAMTVDFAIQILSVDAYAEKVGNRPSIEQMMRQQGDGKDWQGL